MPDTSTNIFPRVFGGFERNNGFRNTPSNPIYASDGRGIPYCMLAPDLTSYGDPIYADRITAQLPIAVIIARGWEGAYSGFPFHVAQMMSSLQMVPPCSHLIICTPDSDETMEMVAKLSEYQSDNEWGKWRVLYDSTGTFDAMYPREWFVPVPNIDERASLPNMTKTFARYEGPVGGISEVMLRASWKHRYDKSVDAISNANMANGMPAITNINELWKCEMDVLMSMGQLSIPQCEESKLFAPYIRELGIHGNAATTSDFADESGTLSVRLEYIMRASYMTPFGVLPMSAEMESEIDALDEFASKIDPMMKIWRYAMKTVPFSVSIPQNEQRCLSDMDADAIRAVGQDLGVDSTIEALFSGVPIEDIMS